MQGALSWIDANIAALELAVGLVTALVWLTYLQLLLASFRRQRRPKILVNLGAGVGLNTRCFVSNLGFEPIYVFDVFIDIVTNGETWSAVITDRAELTPEQLGNPGEATNQGPLSSGATLDIGSFRDMAERVNQQFPVSFEDNAIDTVTITVAATTAASDSLVGARRRFAVRRDDNGITRIRPKALDSHQIRSRRARRRLKHALQARL